jgi:hypothetical protein
VRRERHPSSSGARPMTKDFDDRFVAALHERGWPFEHIDDGI